MCITFYQGGVGINHMRDKALGEELTPQKITPRPYVESTGLGKLFKRHGIYDGRLFHSMDKVTYTFVDNEEVLSLHFDKSKKAIFYKGHNISNVSLGPDQWRHLEIFQTTLAGDPKVQDFVEPYKETLQSIRQAKDTAV